MVKTIIDKAAQGERVDDIQALAFAECTDLDDLMTAAAARRDRAHGDIVSYSPKVFIPLTHLCRDVCRYCTFAHTPGNAKPAYLSVEQAVAIARAGAKAGCHEALFTLGDQPELRYRAAREALAELGHTTTISYLAEVAKAVHEETGMLPHLNPGLMSAEEIISLREVSVSMGLMLESASPRLCEKGGPHYGCPDKLPSARLASMHAAGEHGVPFTSGILIGIGETRVERIEALLALRDLHEAHGHLQEIIVQNFRAKADTAMANAPEPDLQDHLWSIAVARLLMPEDVSVQAPPNLNPHALDQLLAAGINDFGGVSPVTADHVNPEAPWPLVQTLSLACEAAGKSLAPRLPIYPAYAHDPERWLAPSMRASVLAHQDTDGYGRPDLWIAGDSTAQPPAKANIHRPPTAPLKAVLNDVTQGKTLSEQDIVRLFQARGSDVEHVRAAADELRHQVNGDTVTYAVNRNVNYTNLCYFGCKFCAFSKGKKNADLRGEPYDLDLGEIARRTEEAWQRGATEICLQGGIHPNYTGDTYVEILRAVKGAAPDIHVHAFSPLEVWQGAATLDVPLADFLSRLQDEGLSSLPGTAAEILDDSVRELLCPDKINTEQWLEVMRTAHSVGLRSTATIMFGHLEDSTSWARHLIRVRDLAAQTGGFTEFVPLPYVHMESPLYRQGRSRMGPTWREAMLMHAVARLVLHPHITNIQASWVKLGPEGISACLSGGVNDIGGTLMNESITRAAGAAFGEELPPAEMEALIRSCDRTPRQRTTFYGEPPQERIDTSFTAAPLTPKIESRQTRSKPRGPRTIPVRFGTAG